MTAIAFQPLINCRDGRTLKSYFHALTRSTESLILECYSLQSYHTWVAFLLVFVSAMTGTGYVRSRIQRWVLVNSQIIPAQSFHCAAAPIWRGQRSCSRGNLPPCDSLQSAYLESQNLQQSDLAVLEGMAVQSRELITPELHQLFRMPLTPFCRALPYTVLESGGLPYRYRSLT